jgi:hypothetical protein
MHLNDIPDPADICHAQPGDRSGWDVILYGIDGQQCTVARTRDRAEAEAVAHRIAGLVTTWIVGT